MSKNVLMGQFRNLYVANEEINILAKALQITGSEILANKLIAINRRIYANLDAISAEVAQKAYHSKK